MLETALQIIIYLMAIRMSSIFSTSGNLIPGLIARRWEISCYACSLSLLQPWFLIRPNSKHIGKIQTSSGSLTEVTCCHVWSNQDVVLWCDKYVKTTTTTTTTTTKSNNALHHLTGKNKQPQGMYVIGFLPSKRAYQFKTTFIWHYTFCTLKHKPSCKYPSSRPLL